MEPLAWNANVVRRVGGSVTATFSGKWINCFSETGKLLPISSYIFERGHDTSAWRLKFPKLATGVVHGVSSPLWSPIQKCSHRLSHAWFDVQAEHVSPVECRQATENEVSYPNAFGDGVHLSYRMEHRRNVQLQKLVTIERGREAVHGDIRFSWIVRTPSNVKVRRTANGGFGWQYGSDEMAGFAFKPALAWDQFGHVVPVKLTVRQIREGVWRVTKTLTTRMVAELVGPITVDATLVVYPDAGTGATTVDGNVSFAPGGGDTYANIRGGAGDGFQDATDNITIAQITASPIVYTQMTRGIFTLDTSPIGTGTVTAATFEMVGSAKTDTEAKSPGVVVVTSTPAANNALQASDYSQLGSTAKSDEISYTSYVADNVTYNTFTISDLTIIATTGITKLGVRESEFDAPNVDPGLTAGNSVDFGIWTSDALDATIHPKLTVTYTTARATSLMQCCC